MINMIRRIFKIAGEKQKILVKSTFLNILQNFCNGALYVIILLALSKIVDGDFRTNDLWLFSFSMLAVFIIRIILEYFVIFLQASLGFEIMNKVRIEESERLSRLPLGTFQSEKMGKLCSVFSNDMNFTEQRCISLSANFIAGMASFTILSLVLFFMNYRLMLISVLGIIPAYFIYNTIKRKSHVSGTKRHIKEAKLIGTILEYISSMETIRAYSMNDTIFKDITQDLDNYHEAVIDDEIKNLPLVLSYLLFLRLGMGLIFFFGLIFYLNNMISLSTYIFFAVMSGIYYKPLEALMGDFILLNRISLCLDRMDALHSLPIMQNQENIEYPQHLTNYTMSLQDVSYTYNEEKIFNKQDTGKANIVEKEKPLTINKVTAVFSSGTFSAIVGSSGSGKSTLLMLLARFWDIEKGQVTLDGVNIKDIPQKNLMKAVSMVFQDVYLFSGTLEDNIRMAKEDATDEEVVSVAKVAHCHDFIMRLPKGYKTIVSEVGSSLSGGERQRISIARALLKNAPIILLDEAFSSVDPENAWAIQQALSVLTLNKTVIMIAHTLNHIRNADQILVMNNGEIVERGTHQELLDKNTFYKDLWDKETLAKSWKVEVNTI